MNGNIGYFTAATPKARARQWDCAFGANVKLAAARAGYC